MEPGPFGFARFGKRLKALAKLHSEGIRTYAMIALILPKAEGLGNELKGRVDYVVVDRMNYHYADWVYRSHKIEWASREEFFIQKGEELKKLFEKEKIPCQLLF